MFSSNRHAIVVAYLALLLALSGTAYARHLVVNGSDVVDDSLTGSDIRAGSVPEGDLRFNAVRSADINVETFSTQTSVPMKKDGSIVIKGKDITIAGGFNDALGIGTFSITNTGSTPAQIKIRPYLDGRPHGDQIFTHVVQPNSTDLSTLTSTFELHSGINAVGFGLTLVNGESAMLDEASSNWIRVSEVHG